MDEGREVIRIQSNICVSMLCKISEFVSIVNNEIFIKNENLIIDGKKLLVYNIDSMKKRRKYKNEYEYFNPIKYESHYEFLINFVMEIEDIEGICVEGKDISFYLQNDVCIVLKLCEDYEYSNEREKIVYGLIKLLDV